MCIHALRAARALGDRRDVLDHAGLVVREHHRDDARSARAALRRHRRDRSARRASTASLRTFQPARASSCAGFATHGCSIALTAICVGLRYAAAPLMNRLFASVPPDTNTTCDGLHVHQRRDLLARAVHRLARLRAELVAARRVAVLLRAGTAASPPARARRAAWSRCGRSRRAPWPLSTETAALA